MELGGSVGAPDFTGLGFESDLIIFRSLAFFLSLFIFGVWTSCGPDFGSEDSRLDFYFCFGLIDELLTGSLLLDCLTDF